MINKIDPAPILDFIESCPCGFYLTDAHGNLTHANSAFAKMLGYETAQDVQGLNLSHDFFVNPQDYESFYKAAEAKSWVVDHQVKNIRKDAQVLILAHTARLLKDSLGRVIGLESIVRDVTDDNKAHERLRIENAKLQHILNTHEEFSSILQLEDLVDFVVHKAIEILDVKRCSLMLLDHTTKELCIKSAHGLSDDIIQDTRIKMGDQISGLVALYGTPLLISDMDTNSPIARKSRSTYSGRSFMSVPIRLEKKIIGVVNVADKGSNSDEIFTQTDLRVLCAIVRQAAVAIENANLYRELKYLSITDALTGLYNHRHFVKSLDHEIKRMKRYPGSLCLMMIDVDQFKSYNDAFGHQEGDQLIKEVANILQVNLREIDVACRYGGDEFAVILLETKIFKAELVAKKLCKAMENLVFKRKVTLSIGIAAYASTIDRHELILKADRALYQSKKEGRNRINVYA